MRIILILGLLVLGVISLASCGADRDETELASLRSEMLVAHQESLARMAALQDRLDLANAGVIRLEGRVDAVRDETVKGNPAEYQARIDSVQRTLDAVYERIGHLQEDVERLESVAGDEAGVLMPSDATADELKERLADCISGRFGALGPVMAEGDGTGPFG